MFIKVCGITRASDAIHAVEQGATAVGFVFWPRSPRFIAAEQAADIVSLLPPAIATVGVFVNESVEAIRNTAARAGIAMVQLHGDEPASYAADLGVPVIRSMTLDNAVHVAAAWPAETTLLLDAEDREKRGGTGRTVDWQRAAGLAAIRRTVLAGGLTPSNVGDAIATVRPYGVDVSSGVEAAPGVKDVEKVTRFVAQARRAFEGR
jgi:phosphoribosylanthranilate isomerase